MTREFPKVNPDVAMEPDSVIKGDLTVAKGIQYF
jgi:hypothetical protein